jgi:tetratricopeptide (TPR) repeat protein
MVLLVVGTLASGCLATRVPAWTTPTSTAIPVTPAAHTTWVSTDAPSAAAELVSRGELAWEDRADEGAAREAIDTWSRALEAAPTDAVLWARLARAQYFLADAHLSRDPGLSQEATETFASAITAAEHALLARTPAIGSLLRTGAPFTSIVPFLELADVPAIYWRTMALWRWARPNGSFVQQSLREEVRASMARVAQLDRAYDGAGADQFLGDLLATSSSMAGGDVERAQQHFEYAIYAAPDHLAGRVLYAVDLATKLQDRALFVAQLERVIASDPGGSDVAPENVAAQARARDALARVAQLFP